MFVGNALDFLTIRLFLVSGYLSLYMRCYPGMEYV